MARKSRTEIKQKNLAYSALLMTPLNLQSSRIRNNEMRGKSVAERSQFS
jgi:hypothetical protein